MKMKQLAIISLVALAMTAMVLAQARGTGLCYREIRAQSPVMIEGPIVKIEESDLGTGRYGKGLHLFVRNNGQESEVHLGPQAWWKDQGLQLQQGDTVRIKAFNGTLKNGSSALFAAEVSSTAHGKSIILRDGDGFPRWRQSLRKGRGLGRGPARNNNGSPKR